MFINDTDNSEQLVTYLKEEYRKLKNFYNTLKRDYTNSLKENESLKSEIEILNDRVDTLLEINAKLRQSLKSDVKRYLTESEKDDMIDFVATLANVYTYTSTKDMEEEFGLSEHALYYLAKILNFHKDKEARQKAVEYLQIQDRKLTTYRTRRSCKNRSIKQVAKNGRVLNVFDDILQAAEKTGYSPNSIKSYCTMKKRRYVPEGYTFRFGE